MNAANGHHDDIITATAIAMYVSDSFQAKQTRYTVKNNYSERIVKNMLKSNKKVKIRRGIYNNNA
jgi:hypothetical protein